MTDLLRQMIAIPSLSGDEKAVSDFLQARLTAEGFTPHRCVLSFTTLIPYSLQIIFNALI